MDGNERKTHVYLIKEMAACNDKKLPLVTEMVPEAWYHSEGMWHRGFIYGVVAG